MMERRQQTLNEKETKILHDSAIKVSVILPVYNVVAYLRQCLDSVQKQTLKEIEVICIDDNSSDNSLRILHEYEQKDARFFVIENKQHCGAATCRNQGIKMACGEYLSILDSDDCFELDMLETAYCACKVNGADICAYDFWEFDSETGDVVRLNEHQFGMGYKRIV